MKVLTIMLQHPIATTLIIGSIVDAVQAIRGKQQKVIININADKKDE